MKPWSKIKKKNEKFLQQQCYTGYYPSIEKQMFTHSRPTFCYWASALKHIAQWCLDEPRYVSNDSLHLTQRGYVLKRDFSKCAYSTLILVTWPRRCCYNKRRLCESAGMLQHAPLAGEGKKERKKEAATFTLTDLSIYPYSKCFTHSFRHNYAKMLACLLVFSSTAFLQWQLSWSINHGSWFYFITVWFHFKLD